MSVLRSTPPLKGLDWTPFTALGITPFFAYRPTNSVYASDSVNSSPKVLPWVSIGRPETVSDSRRSADFSVPESELRNAFASAIRSEDHTYELQSLMSISYAVLCLKKHTQYINKSEPYTTDTQS